MRRIALILLVFILLTEGPRVRIEQPMARTALSLDTHPLWVSVDRAVHGYGALRLFGLWALRSSNPAFGGISSLLVNRDGRFIALSDGGDFTDFAIGEYRTPNEIAALPRRPTERMRPHWEWDSESMTRDPVSGKIWVGFEHLQRICRYAPDFARIERCAEPPAMQDWPPKGGIESLVRFSDGRFLAIEEDGTANWGVHDVLLWAGDPVEPKTPPPVHLRYVAPTGYWPTDALWLGGDRLLVLNRRMTLAQGFTAKLVMVRLPRLVAGAVLRGTLVTDFRGPGPVDNLEALALGRDASGPVLWVASDDNHAFFERSLLYKFTIPRDWVSDAPAPR